MQEKQIYSTSTIAEMTNGIILAKFEKTMKGLRRLCQR